MRGLAFIGIGLLCACGSGDAGGGGGGSGSGSNHGDAPGGVGEPAELMGMTLYHNQVRAMVNTPTPLPALEWDPALADYAAAWAAKCQDTEAPSGLIDHDPDRTNVAGYQYIGENIFAAGGQTATAKQAVDDWATEGANYDPASGQCTGGQVCGHYTQIVWRTTTHVGCALHNCTGLQFPSSIVCDYGPGGNSGGPAY
jgi:hypothetical protein